MLNKKMGHQQSFEYIQYHLDYPFYQVLIQQLLRILQYQHRQSSNMLQRWIDHLESWKAVIPSINHLTYEELYKDYDSTTGRLADILKMELKDITRPGIDAPSSLPWKGIVGNWQNYFSQGDIDYYNSLMPPEKCGLV